MKDNKKVTTLILVLVLTITVILGGTFAYWQWATSTAQETLVNVSLTDDAKMYIDFPSNELTNMYPTSDCDANGTSSWVTEITVDNGTGVLLSPKFKLKVKIQDKNGQTITNVTNPGNSNPNRHYIKFAVTGENESCNNALFTGRFDEDTQTFKDVPKSDPHYAERDAWYDSELITLYDNTTKFPIVSGKNGSGVSFYAHPNTQTKQRFRVYVWLDKDYVSVTQGTTSTDTMQDAKVTVSWSENSGLEQVKKAAPVGEAVAIYSIDDESLRFYRVENPSAITLGSTYNGRTVTEVYTGFENSSNVPWKNPDYYYDIKTKTIIFEDYIYPVSTSDWFGDFNCAEYFDLTKLDVSNVTDMSFMFICVGTEVEKLSILGLETWDTSNVTDMSYMFLMTGAASDGTKAEEINISNLAMWDVSNVTNMEAMFCDAAFISDLNLNNWDTSSVINMSYLFSELEGKIMGIENWDTSKVTDMSGMFYKSTIENELDLGGWNVCLVTIYSEFVESFVGDMVEPFFGNSNKCNAGNPGYSSVSRNMTINITQNDYDSDNYVRISLYINGEKKYTSGNTSNVNLNEIYMNVTEAYIVVEEVSEHGLVMVNGSTFFKYYSSVGDRLDLMLLNTDIIDIFTYYDEDFI